VVVGSVSALTEDLQRMARSWPSRPAAASCPRTPAARRG
jgi:hypothetical protein